MKLRHWAATAALIIVPSLMYAADTATKDAAPPAAATDTAAAKPTETKPVEAAKPAEAKKEEKLVLKADADPEVKAAIDAADTANAAAKKVGFEWYIDDKTMSDFLQDAIKAGNAGDKDTAIKLAKKVELAGKMGVEQAEKAKTAGPRF